MARSGGAVWRLGRFTLEPWMAVLGLILLVSLILRLWGAKWGLPFAYLTDEERVYVKGAARMAFEGGIDPHYFQNPPLYTYMLRAAFAVLHPGSEPATLLNQLPAARRPLPDRAGDQRPAGDARRLVHLSRLAALLRRAQGRPARGGADGGQLPAGLLRARGAQQRAGDGLRGALAGRHRRDPDQGQKARLRARRHRRRPGDRDQVHRRDRLHPAADGGPAGLRASSRQRLRMRPSRSASGPSPSSSSTPTRCSTSPSSTPT